MQYPKKNLLGLLLALAFILPVAATAQEGDAPGPDPAPASQDALAKAIKEINERFIYFEQVGKFEIILDNKRDRIEDMTQLANFHFALSYLLVVVNSWLG